MVITGDTYAERAAAGQLSGRPDSTPTPAGAGGQVTGDQPVFVAQTQPSNLPVNAVWFQTDASGNLVKIWVNV